MGAKFPHFFNSKLRFSAFLFLPRTNRVVVAGMRQAIILPVLLFVLMAGASAEDKHPLFLPFDVKMGEQLATMKTGMELFGVIEKPVKNDVIVSLEKESPLFIINAFPCKEDGTVLEGQVAGIVFGQNTREVKFNATMDKKPLPLWTYLMNVVAHGKTSRVVFTVADKEGEVKMPDLSKIFNFLKNK